MYCIRHCRLHSKSIKCYALQLHVPYIRCWPIPLCMEQYGEFRQTEDWKLIIRNCHWSINSVNKRSGELFVCCHSTTVKVIGPAGFYARKDCTSKTSMTPSHSHRPVSRIATVCVSFHGLRHHDPLLHPGHNRLLSWLAAYRSLCPPRTMKACMPGKSILSLSLINCANRTLAFHYI